MVAATGGRSDVNGELLALIPALRAFARSFLRQQSDADDLVQETLLRAIANIHQFSPGTSMRSWLFTIMRNCHYTRYRRARREQDALSQNVFDTEVPEAQEWSSEMRDVEAALGRLPAEQREVLVLVGALGTSYQDAAAICGCSIGTIKSRLNRGRTRLARELGEEYVPGSHSLPDAPSRAD